MTDSLPLLSKGIDNPPESFLLEFIPSMLSVLVPVFNVKSTLQSLILLLEFDPSIPGQDLRLLTTFR